jgi:hypothetical protein
MPILILLPMILVVLSIQMKYYFQYKYLMIEQQKNPSDNLVWFLLNPLNRKLMAPHLRLPLPIIGKATSSEASKAKIISNLFFCVAIVAITFLLSYLKFFYKAT